MAGAASLFGGLLPLSFSGGSATSQNTSDAGQALTLDYNPAFLVGSGTLDSSPSASPTTSSSPVSAPSLVSPYPAGQGLTTLNTALPASAATTSTLSSSTLMLLLIGGAALMLLSGGKR